MLEKLSQIIIRLNKLLKRLKNFLNLLVFMNQMIYSLNHKLKNIKIIGAKQFMKMKFDFINSNRNYKNYISFISFIKQYK